MDKNIIEKYHIKIKYPFKSKTKWINKEPRYTSFVYLVLNPLSKAYKIGITDDFHKRYKCLEASAGCALKMILVLELTHFDEPAELIEEFLHDYFKHKWFMYEWFYLNKKDIREILTLFYEIEGEMIYGDFEEIDHPFFIETYLTRNKCVSIG